MNGFTFYPSYHEAIKTLDPETRLALYDAISYYGIEGKEPDLEGLASALFELIRPNIDTSIKRRNAGVTGGKVSAENKAKLKQSASKRSSKSVSKSVSKTPSKSESKTSAEDATCLSTDIDKEIEIEKEKDIKHIYGEYKHIRLTTSEYDRLCSEFGTEQTNRAIRIVDEYCQTSGKKYKDYNLVIRKWGIEQAIKDQSKGRPKPREANFSQRTNNYAEVERNLIAMQRGRV